MRLLLAIDGSKYSDAATQAVASQIKTQNTEVVVLQVVEPRIYSTPPQMAVGYEPEQAEYLKEKFQEAHKSVDRAADSLRAAGFHVSTRVVEGEPRTTVLDVAAEWKADLIVLGSHGRKGLERFVLGSVAETVARHAYSSVFIVRLASS
jgi:nucleotide-binding universal stress UspA family protein